MHEVTPASVKSFKRLLAAKLSSAPVFPFTGMDISVDALPGGSGGGSWSFEGDHLALLGLYSEDTYPYIFAVGAGGGALLTLIMRLAIGQPGAKARK